MANDENRQYQINTHLPLRKLSCRNPQASTFQPHSEIAAYNTPSALTIFTDPNNDEYCVKTF